MKKRFLSILLIILFFPFLTIFYHSDEPTDPKNIQKSANKMQVSKKEILITNAILNKQGSHSLYISRQEENIKLLQSSALDHKKIVDLKLDLQQKPNELNETCIKKLQIELENLNSKNQIIQKLTQFTIGEWFFSEEEYLEFTPPPVSTIDKFYQALAMAGLLESKKIKGSDNEALKLLYEVYLEDQNNSAPLLFSALIELRRGHTSESLHLLQKAKRTSTYYNSYVTNIAKEIFKTIHMGSDYISAISLLSQIPIPKVISLQNLLKSRDSIVFVKQLMQRGLNDSLIINDMEWSILDYAVGAAIYKKKFPNQKIPTHDEISQRKSKLNPLSKYNVVELLENNCDFSSLDKLAELTSSRLKETQNHP